MEEEKRIAPRVLFNSSVRYHEKGVQKYSDTIGKDISSSGIGFISNEFIPSHSKILFELRLPWHQEPVQALAEVVWVSSQPYSERFNVGAKFLDPTAV
ncbi:MAG: PilZ domain-containing protein [Candidatus Omnitrophica bacterium]|nr:PilZ domain-containing protein [Candidatus Omnitrophota bacterium]